MKRLNGKVTEQRPEGVKSQIHEYHRVLTPALWAGKQPVRGPEAGDNSEGQEASELDARPLNFPMMWLNTSVALSDPCSVRYIPPALLACLVFE